MARILAYTSPAAGHLFPLTPILDELAGRGHHITVRTLAAQVPLMKAHGFAAAPISERVEAIKLDDWRAGNARQALKRAVQCFCARAEHDAPDLRQAIADERPDALLVDINSWGALAAAEAWGGTVGSPVSLPAGVALARRTAVRARSPAGGRSARAAARHAAATGRPWHHRTRHAALTERCPPAAPTGPS